MKRFLYILLSILLILNITSCTQRKAQPQENKDEKTQTDSEEKEKEDKPDKKEGEKLLHNYARALILRDTKIKMYYSGGLKKAAADFTPMTNPHPNGYTVDTMEEKEGKLEGKLKMFTVYTGEPYYSSDESKITVIKENGTYVIDKIEKSKSTEVSEKDKTLHMREDGDVKGKEVIKLDEIPRFATPQGASPDQKFTIGSEKFGPIALDPKDEKLALSTVGQYPSLMILDTKKKQAKPIDLYFEGSVQSIAWSQDGKFMAAEIANKNGARYINIYDVEKEKKIDDPMKTVMKPDKYNVNNPYWISESELVFNVSGIGQLSADEQKKAGAYKFDVKNVNLSKF